MIRAVFISVLLPMAAWGALGRGSAAGSRHVYLLAAPIEQKVKGNCGVLGGIWAVNLAWSATMVTGSYLCFHDPISAGMVAASSFSQDYFYSSAGLRTANEVIGRWRRRKDLRKIAALTRAQEIRVITTGESKALGLLNAQLHSKSFVFVEVAGDKPPPAFEGREWLPVNDLAQTKVRLGLELPGYGEIPALELSLADIFAGAKIPPEVEKAWLEALDGWSQALPFWDRYVSHKTFNDEARVSASLVKGGEALYLGDYARGSSVKMVLGQSRLRRVRRFLDEIVLGRDPLDWSPRVQAQGIMVHDNADCSKWYRRLLGAEILAP